MDPYKNLRPIYILLGGIISRRRLYVPRFDWLLPKTTSSCSHMHGRPCRAYLGKLSIFIAERHAAVQNGDPTPVTMTLTIPRRYCVRPTSCTRAFPCKLTTVIYMRIKPLSPAFDMGDSAWPCRDFRGDQFRTQWPSCVPEGFTGPIVYPRLLL